MAVKLLRLKKYKYIRHSAFPQEARLPFYVELFILAVCTFISIKKDIKIKDKNTLIIFSL